MDHCAAVKKEMVIILIGKVIKREIQVAEEFLLADSFYILKCVCVRCERGVFEIHRKSLGGLHTKHINRVYLWGE